MASARLWHFVAGLVLLAGYLSLKKPRGAGAFRRWLPFVVGTVPALYVGSALPDWDITLFSIGAHRNPLFHSALPYVFLGYLSAKLRLLSVVHALGASALVVPVKVGFALGLSSHLLLDILQYGDVRWLPGGTLDRLWLAGHAVLLWIAAWYPQSALGTTLGLRSVR
jgi:hypothetical protein